MMTVHGLSVSLCNSSNSMFPAKREEKIFKNYYLTVLIIINFSYKKTEAFKYASKKQCLNYQLQIFIIIYCMADKQTGYWNFPIRTQQLLALLVGLILQIQR